MYQDLPYDLGNLGDLLKHGFLAEFVTWWIQHIRRPLIFYDPFGGVPWQEPPVPAVLERLQRLNDTALGRAQKDLPGRYLGSSHMVCSFGRLSGIEVQVYCSDREEGRRRGLLDSGLQLINLRGFDPADGCSLLSCELKAGLVLLDPFAESFPDYYVDIFNRLLHRSLGVTALLFVLMPLGRNRRLETYHSARRAILPMSIAAACGPISCSGVRGEGEYEAEVVLDLSDDLLATAETLPILVRRLRTYCRRLGEALYRLPDGNDQEVVKFEAPLTPWVSRT